MTELETVGLCILIVIYGCVFYMAGRENLLELVVTMLRNAVKELSEKFKENDDEEVK